MVRYVRGDRVASVARVFWVAVGAAAGVWAYRRGSEAVAAARERSALENLQVASQTATRLAATGAKVVAVAGAQGAKVAARLSPAPQDARPPSEKDARRPSEKDARPSTAQDGPGPESRPRAPGP